MWQAAKMPGHKLKDVLKCKPQTPGLTWNLFTPENSHLWNSYIHRKINAAFQWYGRWLRNMVKIFNGFLCTVQMRPRPGSNFKVFLALWPRPGSSETVQTCCKYLLLLSCIFLVALLTSMCSYFSVLLWDTRWIHNANISILQLTSLNSSSVNLKMW